MDGHDTHLPSRRRRFRAWRRDQWERLLIAASGAGGSWRRPLYEVAELACRRADRLDALDRRDQPIHDIRHGLTDDHQHDANGTFDFFAVRWRLAQYVHDHRGADHHDPAHAPTDQHQHDYPDDRDVVRAYDVHFHFAYHDDAGV